METAEIETVETEIKEKNIVIEKKHSERKPTSSYTMIRDSLPGIWGGHLVTMRGLLPEQKTKYQDDEHVTITEIRINSDQPILITIFEGIKTITKGIKKNTKMEITSLFSQKKLDQLFSVLNTTMIRFGSEEKNEIAEYKIKTIGENTVTSTIELTAYNMREFIKLVLLYAMLEL
jgi:hypothetical protein